MCFLLLRLFSILLFLVLLNLSLLVATFLTEKMTWFAIHIFASFGLVATVAFLAPLEVVVLALRADPSTVREVEVILAVSIARLL